MLLENLIAIWLLFYLQRKIKHTSFYYKWFRLGQVLLIAFVILIFAELGWVKTNLIPEWMSYNLSHIIIITVIYIALKFKEFSSARSTLYSILPLVIISILMDWSEKIFTQYYDKFQEYFHSAYGFAILWWIVFTFINRKQNLELEKQRLLAVEKEKEYRITEALKEKLEIQVQERTAALVKQKEELEISLKELKSTQAQLIQSEKMASLGELTAGIAHEIQNPLNFINNFSEVNSELIEELNHEIQKGNFKEVKAISLSITENEKKINHHGKRAESIVKGMLQHSRSSNGIKEAYDINALADEFLRLAYHGLRAKDKSFNATMKTNFDSGIGFVQIIPQDMGRVILNLISNAFYSVMEKKKQQEGEFEPTVTVTTKKEGSNILISVMDNGNGIPKPILDKIFHPFFTTKPTGQGTGLGLSMSYDIVTQGHGGEIKVETKEGEGSNFIIILPI